MQYVFDVFEFFLFSWLQQGLSSDINQTPHYQAGHPSYRVRTHRTRTDPNWVPSPSVGPGPQTTMVISPGPHALFAPSSIRIRVRYCHHLSLGPWIIIQSHYYCCCCFCFSCYHR